MNLFRLSRENLEPQLTIPVEYQSVSYFDLQPRAEKALQNFVTDPVSKLLILKGENHITTFQNIEKYLLAYFTETEQLTGVHYRVSHHASGEYRITLETAKSKQDNFIAHYQVKSTMVFDENLLFGYVLQPPVSVELQLQAGLVHQTNGGILILPVAPFLENPALWQRLEQILLTQRFEWVSCNPFKPLPCQIPGYNLDLKVILIGDREELGLLNTLSPHLYSFADYAELDQYLMFSEEQKLITEKWVNYIRSLVKNLPVAVDTIQPTISDQAINRLYQLSIRESEDRYLLPLPVSLSDQLRQISHLSAISSQIEVEDIDNWWQAKVAQRNLLQQRVYAEILNEQVYIATDGEEIGQINGLSVVEYDGLPFSFGEPCRISCVVRFGEGELLDIERKNELAGNLHAKGMMIAEACLANLLELQSQLPFSASLVFEQSYTEIDGDSASLAAFCVLCSALAELPLPQNIALTGSIDQFGLVHSVGGVNQKIEGFFSICQQRGLTGKQGVIIPAVVISQLSLSPEVLVALEQQQFHIWAVENVEQVIKILFKRELLDTEENQHNRQKESSLIELISNRIEQNSSLHRIKYKNWLTSVPFRIYRYFQRFYKEKTEEKIAKNN
ncbi:peptidase [Mergibacter septicus]|uniref:Lon protease family protein n=1 Tax=Mergibacter septicus TaxID=221402 RepID=UPI001C780BCD|nr:Lon protease family protein [Mergibacter septicus]QDJ12790.1 peptidase [Mergibacter septicus]